MKRGNCYAASEALYHIMGGKDSQWIPQVMRYRGDTHWFLKHWSGIILDPSERQFDKRKPNYSKARGTGFLTKHPSKRARELMEKLTWQQI